MQSISSKILFDYNTNMQGRKEKQRRATAKD
jgi:hypothetical protein